MVSVSFPATWLCPVRFYVLTVLTYKLWKLRKVTLQALCQIIKKPLGTFLKWLIKKNLTVVLWVLLVLYKLLEMCFYGVFYPNDGENCTIEFYPIPYFFNFNRRVLRSIPSRSAVLPLCPSNILSVLAICSFSKSTSRWDVPESGIEGFSTLRP